MKVSTPNKRKSSPAVAAIEALMRREGDALAGRLFVDEKGRPVAIFWGSGRWETEYIDSPRCADWLARAYFETAKAPLSKEANNQAQGLLRATAGSNGIVHAVHIRLAGGRDVVYHDLCKATGELAKITANGYSVVNDKRIPFIRPTGMLPLPQPDVGNERSLFDLFSDLLPWWKPLDLALLCAWVVGSMRANGPYMVLGLFGPQGSGKTIVTRWLRGLIDPQTAGLRAVPGNERDLFIAAANTHILAYDNVSSIPAWLSDALCRIASGGGYGTRQLYKDSEEVLFDVQRPGVINGISNVITRDDLRDRSLILTLPAMLETARDTEEHLQQRYQQLQPQMLAAVYHCVSAALANLPTCGVQALPRMADWYQWVKAAEHEMGLAAGLLDKARELNRRDSLDTILDSSPIGHELIDLVTIQHECVDTAGGLLEGLRTRQSEKGLYNPHFPRTPHDFSVELRRLEPALRERGIAVKRGRRSGGNRDRIIVLSLEKGNV